MLSKADFSMNRFLRIFWLSLLVSLLSCGGSDGTGTFGPVNDPGSSGSNQLNPGLEGSLLYALPGSGGAARMDIATGDVTFIDNTLGWENNYKDIASVRVEPFRFERSELVLTVSACGDDLASRISCIDILNSEGLRTDGFRTDFRVSWPAQLSPDKEYIALVTHSISLADQFLEIFTRSGELVQSRQLPDNFPFSWLPDGRIMVDGFRKFYFTAPYSAELVIESPLPDALLGSIQSADVSPDGKLVAFSFFRQTDAGSHTELIVYNIETGSLTPLLRSDDTSLARIADPVWSPDGSWILVQVRSDSNLLSNGLRAFVYAVKPDLENPIDVFPYSDTPNTSSLIKLWHKIDTDIPEERWPRRNYYWQP